MSKKNMSLLRHITTAIKSAKPDELSSPSFAPIRDDHSANIESLALRGHTRLQVNFNILNLFEQKTAVERFRTRLATGYAVPVDEVTFYRGVDSEAIIQAAGVPGDPRFLKNSGFQGPREMRFGVKFTF